jgi:hypothetical protein
MEKFFCLCPRGTIEFWRPKKPFFGYIWNEPLLIPIYRYMSTKSHIYKRCGTLRKKSFFTRGYAKIHIQRPLFDNRKDI